MALGLAEISVIIRSSHERTVSCLRSSVTRLFPGCAINLIEKSPFFEAVLETYRIASHASTAFSFILDGDIILSRRSPTLVAESLSRLHNHGLISVHFTVEDKFLGSRDAGNRVFNNRYATELLTFIKNDADRNALRPESDNLFRFADAKGLEKDLEPIKENVGQHAFEQYYRHIYWSMRNLGVKYLRSKHDLLRKLYENIGTYRNDRDYLVAYEGFRDGMGQKKIVLDSSRYDSISPMLNVWGIQEKEPMVCCGEIERDCTRHR